MKNFVKQISIKVGSFYKLEMNLVYTVKHCAVDKHTKLSVKIRISANIQKVEYRSGYATLALVETNSNFFTFHMKKKTTQHFSSFSV